MPLQQLKNHLPTIATLLIGLFFILVLHFKISYSLLPILVAVIGIGLIVPDIKQKQWRLSKDDKWLIATFGIYFLLFLISLIVHKGKGSELDIPSRALLLLPILAVCYKLTLKPIWILYSIVVGTLIAGVVGIVQSFVFKMPSLFPALMYIQAGDIMMTLSLMSFAISFYFKQQKSTAWFITALIAIGLGIFACLLNQARGAWVVAPFIIILLLVFNRKTFSKSATVALIITAIISSFFAGHIVQKRWQQAEREIIHYFEKNNGSSSIGARFDMWKSAWIGIQEKPIFGWGLRGSKEMRKMHGEQKLISKAASQFDHAHNQYLQDTSARGILGLGALLALFFVPLTLLAKNMRHTIANEQTRLWGILGITHILATMGYCLTQAFLSHNSGIMFYLFVLLICYGLQKSSLNSPLAGNR